MSITKSLRGPGDIQFQPDFTFIPLTHRLSPLNNYATGLSCCTAPTFLLGVHPKGRRAGSLNHCRRGYLHRTVIRFLGSTSTWPFSLFLDVDYFHDRFNTAYCSLLNPIVSHSCDRSTLLLLCYYAYFKYNELFVADFDYCITSYLWYLPCSKIWN